MAASKKKATKRKTSNSKSTKSKVKKSSAKKKTVVKTTIPKAPEAKAIDYIFNPTPMKITLSIFISSILALGWINLIITSYITIFSAFMFVVLSAIWIIAASMGSCIFVHLTQKNRITNVLGFLIISLVALFVGTGIYLMV